MLDRDLYFLVMQSLVRDDARYAVIEFNFVLGFMFSNAARTFSAPDPSSATAGALHLIQFQWM